MSRSSCHSEILDWRGELGLRHAAQKGPPLASLVVADPGALGGGVLAHGYRIPGVWGHMLTFKGGPRSGISFRVECVPRAPPCPPFPANYVIEFLHRMKALLFTLIRAFEFELIVPAENVGKKGTSVTQGPREDPNSSALKAGWGLLEPLWHL
ncbi:hypothetical protein FB451DRAFT_1554089 [Mycena latifolia]|nr:hypothetical protein FB451DRAFT_1554089 [Mycena latifolia]